MLRVSKLSILALLLVLIAALQSSALDRPYTEPAPDGDDHPWGGESVGGASAVHSVGGPTFVGITSSSFVTDLIIRYSIRFVAYPTPVSSSTAAGSRRSPRMSYTSVTGSTIGERVR